MISYIYMNHLEYYILIKIFKFGHRIQRNITVHLLTGGYPLIWTGRHFIFLFQTI